MLGQSRCALVLSSPNQVQPTLFSFKTTGVLMLYYKH